MDTINTAKDLNRFIKLTDVQSPDKIIDNLAHHQQIISVEMAKMLQAKLPLVHINE